MSLRRVILVNTAAPDRPNGSMVRYGRMVRAALEQFAREAYLVEELNLAPTQAWLSRFPQSLQTPIRYLCIGLNARRRLLNQRDCIWHLLDGSHAYLLSAVRNGSVPLTITVHDMIPALGLRGELGPARSGRVGRWIIRKALSGLARADALVAVSRNTRNDLIRLASVEPGRVRVVHSAATLQDSVSPLAPLATGSAFILHVAGNNTFYKNRPAVVDVFKIIRQSATVRLKLVGALPDPALLRQVETSGLAVEIEFLSQVSEDELAALDRNAARLLVPSLYEGFGWPPLEAMLQGCPVVCSDAGSLPEVVGEAALIAPAAEHATLANHSLRLLREPDLRRRLVEAGFQQVRQFTLEAFAAGLVATYRAAETRFEGGA